MYSVAWLVLVGACSIERRSVGALLQFECFVAEGLEHDSFKMMNC